MTAVAAPFAGAQCAIATNTYYNPAGEDDVFRRDLFLRTVADLGSLDKELPGAFPLVVTDTSPNHAELRDDVLDRFPTAEFLDGSAAPGIGPQTLNSVRYAYDAGVPFVLRMDPEKYGLVVPAILKQLVDFLQRDNYDIVSIGRSPGEGFASLPPYQQITERVMSRALASLGLPEDTASGIRAMNRRGMELLLQFNPAIYGKQWEFMWYFLLDALVDGLRVGELFLPFIHPREMLRKETGDLEIGDEARRTKAAFYNNKRDDQAALIIPKVVAYAASLGIYPAWDPQRHWVI